MTGLLPTWTLAFGKTLCHDFAVLSSFLPIHVVWLKIGFPFSFSVLGAAMKWRIVLRKVLDGLLSSEIDYNFPE
jgi:hypothetical protein